MQADTCLTGSTWHMVLGRWHPKNSSTARLARVLNDIITESDDPAIGLVLDRHAKEIMK